MNGKEIKLTSRISFLKTSIAFSDLIVICSIIAIASNLFPLSVTLDSFHDSAFWGMKSHIWVSFGIILIWFLSLIQSGSLSYSNFGSGTKEYALVSKATIFTFIVVALFSYLLKAEIARSYLIFSLPIGLILLLMGRWLWRKYLHRQRTKGNFAEDAVVLGSSVSISGISSRIKAHPEVGIRIVGAFTPNHLIGEFEINKFIDNPVPYWGTTDNLVSTVRSMGIRNIIVGASSSPSSEEIRKLGWELLPGNERLFLETNVLDVVGPRLQLRPIAGMSIIEVMEPEFEGINRLLKRLIDLLIGSIALLFSIPIFIFVAYQIKAFDKGPIFYTQFRVGKNGKYFKILKFRSMKIESEKQSSQINIPSSERAGNEILFKIKDDPRVTKPGRWLRKTSIDELPQLLNVLSGSMSLVGPRPPLPSEAESYEAHVHTKFMVKPGITGLWQVSGRSDLSWEESVRADLSYVQNWSIFADLIILWRTIKVVISGRGAY